MFVSHGSRQYNVGEIVARTISYRLYFCSQNREDMHKNLLQIATGLAYNGELDRASYILGTLLDHANKLEDEYNRVKTDPKDMLNYKFGFPELLDSFLCEKQGGRRINILGFRRVEDVRSMVPLYNIVHHSNRRIDLQTSVWIMGKLLRILTFAHSAGISVGDVSLGNVLIEPQKHYLIVFNWANARQHQGGVPQDMVRDEIRSVATTVIKVLGGTDEHPVPNDGGEQYEDYIAHLATLASRGASTAESAHRMFYALADRLWSSGFYPFTTLPLLG